jgi:hypothetical protein
MLVAVGAVLYWTITLTADVLDKFVRSGEIFEDCPSANAELPKTTAQNTSDLPQAALSHSLRFIARYLFRVPASFVSSESSGGVRQLVRGKTRSKQGGS